MRPGEQALQQLLSSLLVRMPESTAQPASSNLWQRDGLWRVLGGVVSRSRSTTARVKPARLPAEVPGCARRFPGRKEENWWLVVGDPKGNTLLAIKRQALQKKGRAKLDITAPSEPGTHHLTLFFMCDSYMGCDQVRLPSSGCSHDLCACRVVFMTTDLMHVPNRGCRAVLRVICMCAS